MKLKLKDIWPLVCSVNKEVVIFLNNELVTGTASYPEIQAVEKTIEKYELWNLEVKGISLFCGYLKIIIRR